MAEILFDIAEAVLPNNWFGELLGGIIFGGISVFILFYKKYLDSSTYLFWLGIISGFIAIGLLLHVPFAIRKKRKEKKQRKEDLY